jgi:hypothetical protein
VKSLSGSDLEPHGWQPHDNISYDQLDAPEFVLDGVIAAGAVAFAGERGLGKTSLLIPMMLAVAGLIEDYPFKASIRRRVFYVTEDIDQAKRVINALIQSGWLTRSCDEIKKMFTLCPANRISVEEATYFPKMLVGAYEKNECVDGSTYKAPPVVVLDTVNATLDLDNINDNSAVSKAISSLRRAFGDIPLITVGHVAKAARGDAQRASFKGAGAWEDDTQQTLYLVSEASQRYLVTGKSRFVAEYSEFKIESHSVEVVSVDKLKEEVITKVFFGIPEGVSKLEKEQAQREAKVAAKQQAWKKTQADALAFVTANPGQTVTEIRNSVQGRNLEIRNALEALEDANEVRKEEKGKAKRYFPINGNDTERYGRESNGE